MRIAISKHGRSAIIAMGLAIAGGLTGSAQATLVESSPTFPPIPLSFASPSGGRCFDIAAVCVTPGLLTLTSAVSNFLPAVQDITADATYTGSLTPLPPGTGSLGSFTLTGTVEMEVLGRTSATDTGSWTTELTGMSLSGPLLSFGTLSATLDPDPSNSSTGTTSITPLDPNKSGPFVINSFFDIFVDLTLDDRPPGLPPLNTTIGPIRVVAVPEPSTWAMLLTGFAGLAFAGWRRAAGSAG
ncbi:MAG: PEP-CTERM sorting domain-containing protein [Roseiarcus sp.]